MEFSRDFVILGKSTSHEVGRNFLENEVGNLLVQICVSDNPIFNLPLVSFPPLIPFISIKIYYYPQYPLEPTTKLVLLHTTSKTSKHSHCQHSSIVSFKTL